MQILGGRREGGEGESLHNIPEEGDERHTPWKPLFKNRKSELSLYSGENIEQLEEMSIPPLDHHGYDFPTLLLPHTAAFPAHNLFLEQTRLSSYVTIDTTRWSSLTLLTHRFLICGTNISLLWDETVIIKSLPPV